MIWDYVLALGNLRICFLAVQSGGLLNTDLMSKWSQMSSLWTEFFSFSTIDCCEVVLNTVKIGASMCFLLPTSFGIFIFKALNTWLYCSSDLPRLRRAPNSIISQNLAVESHELRVSDCFCRQTKSSLSVWKKGVFCGTLEWILLPPGETNWSRQASLPEWLKLVCGSASAASNKEKNPG